MNEVPSLLIVSHVFPPDSASVGQHMADVAATMRRRGWDVTVLSGERDFDDPTKRFPSAVLPDGTVLKRLPFSSFGKARLRHRVLGAGLFTAQAALRILFGKKPDLLLVSNAPPFAPFLGPLARLTRGIRYVYWVMDLNPDQIVAIGAQGEHTRVVRAWRWMNRRVYRYAKRLVVLDRFMRERVIEHGAPAEAISMIPPWPHDEDLDLRPEGAARFRRDNGLDGRFVVMYSGNHTTTHPLKTILDAAERLENDDRFVFVFVGGGKGKRDVEARKLRNVVSLPYQPLERLGASLSAADLHVVTMGDPMVGVVHTCKVYGVMSVGRPFIFVGPEQCHVTDLIDETASGWSVRHGDVDGTVALLERAIAERGTLNEKGRAGQRLVASRFSQSRLSAELAGILEESAK